ncbi:MAG: CDP-alcohol phosphatidyltransferase family protein [Akkermansiaceae bacterium]|jgi:cardiolipin synthase (CMP-forming)|nr:CDP-alcohol phosphatidyltransferase family protein [Akkermansiaceae bacterium]MDP4647862.1 CDP-alcohol phosphatidyltransferase family protein [Akkermansiaceae bacterium]MDP4722032.1 CDP-alcohol phosphatidyltransferase family protein [Akkermansiaceae bacterium]MDP4780521.1 CDP-alcohol phosphatidyltransferase family protein [Akkermansiaceae bacterium]MDP4846121.1 CDP-alcohol phosphatidyltransferase family protein [Akkermansiaceae bacterium]
MTHATKVTVARMFLVPVFAFLAIAYGRSVTNHLPDENLRIAALSVFILAAASDGIDGWIARRFNQRSDLGAYLDPIADKFLVLTAVIVLTIFDWGESGWSLPLWFTIIVLLRDSVILGGIRILYSAKRKVAIRPHWTGKVCTVSLFFALGWVMLKVVPFSPAYPCAIAVVFLLWSMLEYIRQGVKILTHPPENPKPD